VAISALELFKIGVGPSSSHTVGPMLAGHRFVESLRASKTLDAVARVQVELFGSLALTGVGHGTDRAVVGGLLGHRPDIVDPDELASGVDAVKASGLLRLGGVAEIGFAWASDLLFLRERLPGHPNALRLTAYGPLGELLAVKTYYSVGGGFVVDAEESGQSARTPEVDVEFPYTSGGELVEMCLDNGLSIAEVVRRNERAWRSDDETREGLLRVWATMRACAKRGLRSDGILPGGLGVERRAPAMMRDLMSPNHKPNLIGQWFTALDWVTIHAMAVNEENAAGGRVVTAPTNGSAGIVPAVLHFFVRFHGGTENDVVDFLLAAAAIGALLRRNASISGAEVGCQGEVGAACSMAAAGLVQVLGGSPERVEHAAEIGLEHNLGLTCDPIGGLVQIPCIERNALGAMKAIQAAQIALAGSGRHHVSLDQVIRAMRDTGRDMLSKYKETSEGGLAVALAEC